MRNAMAGLPFSILKISVNFVSSPMQVKASANQKVWKPFKEPFTAATWPAFKMNEKTNDAAIKPSTNFGNRSQMALAEGRFSFSFLV